LDHEDNEMMRPYVVSAPSSSVSPYAAILVIVVIAIIVIVIIAFLRKH